MKHYEERLEQDLTAIRDETKAIGDRVQHAVKHAVHALLTGDRVLSNRIILEDGHINRGARRLNRLCHAFVARHLPSAGHLRRVSSVLQANIALERIGDYAVTLCREQKQLTSPPDGTIARDIELLAKECRTMLQQAIIAFEQENADLAKGTMIMADQIEHTFSHIFPDLLALGEKGERNLKEVFALVGALTHIERISDQAKNLCEEAVFLVTGEEKAFKIYKIVFLDERNDCLSQMAEAIARKAFPGSGSYSSGGRHPSEKLREDMVDFMGRQGYSLTDTHPRALDLLPEELEEVHVLVSLEGPAGGYVEELPFHTIDLEWHLPELPAEGATDERHWQEIYQTLEVNIRGLMEALRGKEAP